MFFYNIFGEEMRSRRKWMGPEDSSELGNVKCANCVGLMAQDDLRLSPSEYGEAQVSARRTGVTSLNIQGTGANPGGTGLVSLVRPNGSVAKLVCKSGHDFGPFV